MSRFRTSTRRITRLLVLGTLLATLALLTGFGQAPIAQAHPLGNFTVNQYTRLEIGATTVRGLYVLDLAELPTLQARRSLDGNDDGTITAAEEQAYLDAVLAEVMPALQLTIDGRPLPLTVVGRSLTFPPGQAGLDTTRIEADLSAPLAGGDRPLRLAFKNDYATDRVGWREVVIVNGAGVRIEASDVAAVDRSQELRAYPADQLSSPLDVRAANVAFRLDPSAPAFAPAPATPRAANGFGDTFNDILAGRSLTFAGLIAALVAAAGWGALHALSPGHGKTLVGAYLVGSRGTPRHALFLGLTVTVTHTAGVVALGLAVTLASQTFLPERLYPWLSLASGLTVVLLGATILRARLRSHRVAAHHDHHHDHAHDHDHAHHHGRDHSHEPEGHGHSHLPPGADGTTITWRNLLALGVAGGLLPCPSALLALLGAVAVGQPGLGVVLVLAFSLGLAGTLTAIGLLFLTAGRFLERRPLPGPWPLLVRLAPVGGAAAVTLTGFVIVSRALVEVWPR